MSRPVVLAVQGVFDQIPSPGLVTMSPRLAASVAAIVAAWLLLLVWSYRRRPFIPIWAVGWLCAAGALFVASQADEGGTLSGLQLAVAGAMAVASGEFFYAGLLYHERPPRWRSLFAVLVITALGYTVLPFLLPARLMFSGTFAAVAAINGLSAARAGRIGRDRQMVGSLVMTVAFTLVVVCSAMAAVAGFALVLGLNAARLILITNAVCYILIAFSQHLFVFEDMMSELRERNRELMAVRAELHHAAITDSLTGLYNRRLFDEVAAHQFEHHRRFNLPISLVFIDIDRFKAVNDTHGHDVGDRLLQHTAHFLNRQVREADYVFRMGGDEFLILISCGEADAKAKAHHLQTEYPATLRQAGLPTAVGLSIGITELPPGIRDIAAAVQEADERMYENKRRRAIGAELAP